MALVRVSDRSPRSLQQANREASGKGALLDNQIAVSSLQLGVSNHNEESERSRNTP